VFDALGLLHGSDDLACLESFSFGSGWNEMPAFLPVEGRRLYTALDPASRQGSNFLKRALDTIIDRPDKVVSYLDG
jgi:hypothetical protein